MILAVIISIAVNIGITLLIVSFALKIYSNLLAKFLMDMEDRFDKKLDINNKIR